MKNLAVLLLIMLPIAINAQPSSLELSKVFITRETPAHDPVMIKENNIYYVFCTGFGISVFSSDDMKNWKVEKPVFDKSPQTVFSLLRYSIGQYEPF